MKESPLMEFYTKIMFAENEEEVSDINAEIQNAIVSKVIEDDKDIMILNLALQVKSNYFLIKDVAIGGTTVMIMGDMGDFDPEQEQLDELHEKEIEDFKDGNVVSMKDFGKKKDEE